MRRKFTNLLVLALAFSSAGFVTSCKDTEEDALAQNKQELVNGYTDAIAAQDANLKTLLAAQVKGLQDQIDAINAALAAIKSCTCGDGTLDARIQAMIDQSISDALANNGDKYMTESDVAAAITAAINDVISKLSDAQKAEVQKMIEDYAAAHPGVSKSDVEELIKGYLITNPGLTSDDVETLIAAYLAKNPQGLTKDDVQTIITEWIYNHQILDKGQVDALIEAAITKALAGYALKSDIPTQAYIESLIDKAINAYAATDNHLTAAEVDGMIEKAINAAKAEWKQGMTQPEVELLVTKAIQDALKGHVADYPHISAADIALEIQKAITEALKDVLGKDALNAYPTTEEVNKLIADALKTVQPGMSEAEIENLVTKIVTEALKGVGNNGLTEAEVKNLVNEIVTERLKNYTTPADVQNAVNEAMKGVLSENDVKALINDAVKQFLADYATTDKVQLLINDAIAKALEGLTPGLTAAEVKNLITEAIKDVITKEDIASYLAPYATTADVLDLIDDELEKALKAYSTTAEVQALIDAAKCACSCLTPEQVAKIASSVLNEWLVAHPYPTSLTKEDVETIAKNVVNDAQVIKELKDAQTGLQNTLTTVQADIAKLQEATSGLSTLKSDVEQNKIDIAKLQTAIEGLDLSQYVTTAVLTAELGTVNKAVQAAQEKADLAYQEAQKALSKYEDVLEQIGKTKDELNQKMVDDYKDLVGQIGKVKDDLATIAGQLGSQISDVQKDATAALTLANSNADKIETLDKTLHWVLYKLGLLEGVVDGLVPNTPVDLSTLITAIADLKSEVEDLKKNYATKEELAQAVKDLTNAYKAADALQDLVIAGLTGAVTVMQGEIAGIEGQILKITGQLGLIDGHLAILDANVLTLDGKVGKLEGAVTLLTGEVATLAGTVALQEGKIISLQGRMTTVEGKVSTLEGKMKTVEGKVSKLETKMETAEGKISTLETQVSTLETTIGKLDTKVEDYKKALDKAIDEVKDDVEAVKKDVATNKDNIEKNKTAIEGLTTTVTNIKTAIDNQITGVIVQGTYNPMYGTFNIPAGVNSNVLVAFYGKADTPYEFPSSELMYYADPSVTKFAKLTDADLAMIGSVDGQINGRAGTLISDASDNAGKVYLTINPAGVDFSKTPIKLMNSQEEASGIELKNLLPSSKLVTFGYTRSVANGFYAADAYLSKADIDKVKVKIDSKKIAEAFRNTFETAVSATKAKDASGTFPSIATLVGTLYNQFNGILPALAVKADYKNADGDTRSVYSNYGIAATAVKAPGFSPDFWNKFEKTLLTDDEKYVDGYYRVMNLIYKINRRVDNYITNTINPRIKDNKIIDFLQNKVANDIAKIDIKPIDEDGSFAGKFNITVYMKLTDDVTISPDGKTVTINGRSVAADPTYYRFVDDGSQKYFVLTFQSQVEDILGQVNYDLNNTKVLVDDIAQLVDYVNDYLGNIEYYETRIENKIDNTIQNFLDKVNGKLVNFIRNISARVQPIALFVEGNKISQLGGTLGKVKFVDASSITIYPTTYTAEVITPCYKKHIAVTNVFKGSASAQDGDAACKAALQRANQGANMNAVIAGGIHQNATLNLADGYIYEVAYSALDYNGQIATRKYYVAKK